MGGFLKGLFSRKNRAHAKYLDSQMELARSYLEKGSKNDRQQACLILEELVRLEPEFTAAWHWLGSTRLHLDDPSGARVALEKALKLQPGWTEIQQSMHMLEEVEKLHAVVRRTGSKIITPRR